MPTDAVLSPAMPAQPALRNVIVAATVGNVLEWFDFLVYGYFAVVTAEVFFPSGNPTVSLLVTFGAFGLSCVTRPLGAIIIGTLADRPRHPHDNNGSIPRLTQSVSHPASTRPPSRRHDAHTRVRSNKPSHPHVTATNAWER